MSYRYERYRERPRRSAARRWIVALTAIVWILLSGLLLTRFVARPLVTRYVEERIAQQLPVQQPVAPLPGPGAVAPPVGEPDSFTISEVDANQWFVDHRHELQGVDAVRLRFLPGQAQAELTIGGVTSTARAGVQVVNGQVVIADAALDPPLGLIVDVQPFATLIQERLNRDLATV
jgi:hypothetical protein